jgi:hypothetical protein
MLSETDLSRRNEFKRSMDNCVPQFSRPERSGKQETGLLPHNGFANLCLSRNLQTPVIEVLEMALKLEGSKKPTFLFQNSPSTSSGTGGNRQ